MARLFFFLFFFFTEWMLFSFAFEVTRRHTLKLRESRLTKPMNRALGNYCRAADVALSHERGKKDKQAIDLSDPRLQTRE